MLKLVFLNVKQLWTIIYRIPKPCKAYSRGLPVSKEDVKRVNVVGVVPVYYRLVVKSKKRRTIRTWLFGYSDRSLAHCFQHRLKYSRPRHDPLDGGSLDLLLDGHADPYSKPISDRAPSFSVRMLQADSKRCVSCMDHYLEAESAGSVWNSLYAHMFRVYHFEKIYVHPQSRRKLEIPTGSPKTHLYLALRHLIAR